MYWSEFQRARTFIGQVIGEDREYIRNQQLWDVYARDTRLDDWLRFMAFLRASSYQCSWNRRGSLNERIPDDIAVVELLRHIATDTLLGTLSIEIEPLLYQCHFLHEDTFEFTVDADPINDEATLDLLFDFMGVMANVLGKDVYIGHETVQPKTAAWAVFRYSVERQRIEV